MRYGSVGSRWAEPLEVNVATVEELVGQYRENAAATLASFTRLYHGKGEECVPIAFATRWSRALERDVPDIDEMAALVRECEALKGQWTGYGIAFYGFCTDMIAMYRALVEADLRSR